MSGEEKKTTTTQEMFEEVLTEAVRCADAGQAAEVRFFTKTDPKDGLIVEVEERYVGRKKEKK